MKCTKKNSGISLTRALTALVALAVLALAVWAGAIWLMQLGWNIFVPAALGGAELTFFETAAGVGLLFVAAVWVRLTRAS